MWLDKILARKGTPYLLLGLAILLVWGQSITFGFVWDDLNFIVDLQSIRSLKNIPRMFYDIEAQTTLAREFLIFRPLRNVHYAILYFLGGKSEPQPWIYHAANLIWHMAVSGMLFSVAFLLLRKLVTAFTDNDARRWAFLAALGFAVHPTTSEVVCWAKGLDDMMVSVFALCALRELLIWQDQKKNYWRSLLFFILALYSKESAMPFAVLPFFIFLRIQPLPFRRNVLLSSGYVVVAALYFMHRHWVLGRTTQIEPLSGSYGQTLIDMLPVAAKYFRLLWGIPPFFVDYSYLKGGSPFFSAEVLVGLIIVLVLIAAGTTAWRRESLRGAGFGLLWTGLFLLPVSNLLPLAAYMAERFLYTPLIGWMIALVAVAWRFVRKPALIIVPLICIVVWAGVAWNRSWIWHDALTLWVRSSQEGPKTSRVEDNAVATIFKLPHVRNVFRRDDQLNKLQVIGAINPADAQHLASTFEQTHKLFPTNDVVTAALAITYAKSGRINDAVPLFQQVAQHDAQNIDAWNNLTQASLDAKNDALAREALEKANALDAKNLKSARLRVRLELETGHVGAARAALQRLQQIDPGTDYTAMAKEVENAAGKTR